MHTKLGVTDWWDPIGNGAYSVGKKDDELRISTGKRKGSGFRASGILRIRRDPSFKSRFIVHSTIRGNGQVDIERYFTAAQLRTMFNCARATDATDKEYTEKYGGEFGIPGLFVRTLNYVIFPCPGIGTSGDPNFCFGLKPFMTQAVEKLIETGKIR